MSEKLISLNPDLKKLRDEGYEVEVTNGYLVLHSVPYVTARREIAMGKLVTDLTLSGDRTQRPGDHQVWFTGEFPCKKNGVEIEALRHSSGVQTLCNGVVVHHRFSCKPPEGYPDYFSKMTRYVEIISNEAIAIDPSGNVSARTYKPQVSSPDESVFIYADSASSRAGIVGLAAKLAMDRVAIIGLGGTGAYLLDLVAKTHAREIHLFDGDVFLQHNAFRAPGAASFDALSSRPLKVDYYTQMYGQMRRGIIPHQHFIDDKNVQMLSGYNFVFLCVDKPSVRGLVSNFLHGMQIPFIDVGMELELIEEHGCLIGTCRTTLCTPDKSDHFSRRVSLSGSEADDIYKSNIQVADLNSLNATMAVIRWKKYCGFYQDLYREHQSTYDINTHQLSRDETLRG